MTKYPWIPRKYYPAVMYACRIIREHKAWNVAIETAARLYQVDKATLADIIRKRQAAGQQGMKRKYSWYALHFSTGTEYNDVFDAESARWAIVKATSSENAVHQIYGRYDRYGTTGFDGDWPLFGEVIRFDSKLEAEQFVEQAQKETDT